MLGLFKSEEQKSAEKFWKSEIGQRLAAHNGEYFGPGRVWEGFSREGQQELCGWLLQRIFGVYEAADAFSAMRLELAAMVSCHAELVILLRNPWYDPIPLHFGRVASSYPFLCRALQRACRKAVAKPRRE
jgi:hypothetical protein